MDESQCMEESQFSILGDSIIAESSEALESGCAGSLSSLPFSPHLSDIEHELRESQEQLTRSISQQTDPGDMDVGLNSLRFNCKCACHLFRNGHISEEQPCQVSGCCREPPALSESLSEMLSQPRGRSSRHCSNGSNVSHKIITTPPNSIVSDNTSEEVIVLSQGGTPPYPPPNLPWARNPDWLWDWNSRPEMYPPKGWPCEVSEGSSTDKEGYHIRLPGLIASHILVLLLGIYIGRKLKQS